MIDSVLETVSLINEFFLNGFLALVAVSVAAPLLGVFLVLRRMPLLGLATPQVAGCGQALAFFLFAIIADVDPADPAEPSAVLQLLGALGAVLAGLLILAVVGRERRFVGVHAGVLFLLAMGLREIFYLESPYHRIFEEAIHHGRVLTVLEEGRNTVLVTCGLLVVFATAFRHRLWMSVFDADQARLNGWSPTGWHLATLIQLGALCALCVPVVGPEVVLTLLLVPPAVLRSVTPSLAWYGPLSALSGLLGAVCSFFISCTEGLDWPTAPALIVTVLGASLLVGGCVQVVRSLRGEARVGQ